MGSTDKTSITVAKERGNTRTLPNLLRWLGVLPAAVLAGWLGRSFGGLFFFLRDPGYPTFVFPLLQLLPTGLAFTSVGAFVAPRYRVATAICLATLCAAGALCIHILFQRAPGVVNTMHALGESLGAILGIAVVAWRHTRQSRT